MSKDKQPFTFWDEEKQVSELHWNGLVLTGTNEATMEMLCRLSDHRAYRQSVADLLKRALALADEVERLGRTDE